MNCPICNNEKVEENSTQCSECSSDLTSFTLINEVSNQRSSLKKLIILSTAVALVSLGGLGYTYMQGNASATSTVDETLAPDNSVLAELEGLKKELATKDAEITSLSTKLEELHATIESSAADMEEKHRTGSHILHVVKEGESLWSISELYHGHGFKHHHIGGHNTVSNPDHIEVGDTLVILN